MLTLILISVGLADPSPADQAIRSATTHCREQSPALEGEAVYACVCSRLQGADHPVVGEQIVRIPLATTTSGSAITADGDHVLIPLGPTFDVHFLEGAVVACGVDAAPDPTK